MQKRSLKYHKRKYSIQAGTPLLLGELDEMVRKYLLPMSKRGGAVNTTIANATAKALMSCWSSGCRIIIALGKKPIFPNEIFQVEKNIVKNGHTWWGSKRDRVRISPWRCIKSIEIWHTICFSCKYRSNTVKVHSSGFQRRFQRENTLWRLKERWITVQ